MPSLFRREMTLSKVISKQKRSAKKRNRELLDSKALAPPPSPPSSSPAASAASLDTVPINTFVSSPTASSAVTCTSLGSRKRLKRRVSFGDILVIPVQPVDESLKNDLFYCRSDFVRFRKESQHIFNVLNQRLLSASNNNPFGSRFTRSRKNVVATAEGFCTQSAISPSKVDSISSSNTTTALRRCNASVALMRCSSHNSNNSSHNSSSSNSSIHRHKPKRKKL